MFAIFAFFFNFIIVCPLKGKDATFVLEDADENIDFQSKDDENRFPIKLEIDAFLNRNDVQAYREKKEGNRDNDNHGSDRGRSRNSDNGRDSNYNHTHNDNSNHDNEKVRDEDNHDRDRNDDSSEVKMREKTNSRRSGNSRIYNAGRKNEFSNNDKIERFGSSNRNSSYREREEDNFRNGYDKEFEELYKKRRRDGYDSKDGYNREIEEFYKKRRRDGYDSDEDQLSSLEEKLMRNFGSFDSRNDEVEFEASNTLNSRAKTRNDAKNYDLNQFYGDSYEEQNDYDSLRNQNAYSPYNRDADLYDDYHEDQNYSMSTVPSSSFSDYDYNSALNASPYTTADLYGNQDGTFAGLSSRYDYGSDFGADSLYDGINGNYYGNQDYGTFTSLSSPYGNSALNAYSPYDTTTDLYGNQDYGTFTSLSSPYGNNNALNTLPYDTTNLYGNQGQEVLTGLSSPYGNNNALNTLPYDTTNLYGNQGQEVLTGLPSTYGNTDGSMPYNQSSISAQTPGINNPYENTQALGAQQLSWNNNAVTNDNMGNFGEANTGHGGEQNSLNSPNYSGAGELSTNTMMTTNKNIRDDLTVAGSSFAATREHENENSDERSTSPAATDIQEKEPMVAKDKDIDAGVDVETVKRKETRRKKIDKRNDDNDDEKSPTKDNSNDELDDEKKDNHSRQAAADNLRKANGPARNDSSSNDDLSDGAQETKDTEESDFSLSTSFPDDALEPSSEKLAESKLNREEYEADPQGTGDNWKDDDALLHNVPLGKLLPQRNEPNEASGSSDQRLHSKDF
ncbi:MAG: hypothetical protein LBJ45_03060 [Holosporaceae bacterium]|nr:hypothetical protein [Holosporaceae bacterium]